MGGKMKKFLLYLIWVGSDCKKHSKHSEWSGNSKYSRLIRVSLKCHWKKQTRCQTLRMSNPRVDKHCGIVFKIALPAFYIKMFLATLGILYDTFLELYHWVWTKATHVLHCTTWLTFWLLSELINSWMCIVEWCWH